MFDLATREKLRFETSKGNILTEDVWDLPITSEKNISLKSIARSLAKQLKDANLVDEFDDNDEPENKEITILKLKLEIVRHILQVKRQEAEASKNQNKIREENQLILSLIEKKQLEELAGLSIEELNKRLK